MSVFRSHIPAFSLHELLVSIIISTICINLFFNGLRRIHGYINSRSQIQIQKSVSQNKVYASIKMLSEANAVWKTLSDSQLYIEFEKNKYAMDLSNLEAIPIDSLPSQTLELVKDIQFKYANKPYILHRNQANLPLLNKEIVD